MLNRWNQEITKGMRVTCQHPRGGVVSGTVSRIYRLPGYGYRVDLREGGSFALDDAKPSPAPTQPDHAYLQHGSGAGPFRTERVSLKHEGADRYKVRFEGLWRRVHIQVNRTFIVYRGARITVQIEGV